MTTTINASTSSGLVQTADTSGVLALQTANTTAVTIDASQNVGIGGTPAQKLDVIGSASRTRWNTSNAYVYQVISNPADSAYATNRVDAASHDWYVSNSAKMTLDSSGNVGIGTSSPATKLQVSNTSGYSTVTVTGNANNGGIISFVDSASVTTSRILGFGSTAGSPDNYALRFDTNGAERMRIDSIGNIGINTSTSSWDTAFKAIEGPYGDSVAYLNGGASIQMASNGYYNGGWKYKGTGIFARYILDCTSTTPFAWFTAPSGSAGGAVTQTQAMTMDSGGSLMIGTTSPGGRLTVAGPDSSGSNNALYVKNSNNNTLFQARDDGWINLGNASVSPYNNTTGNGANMYIATDSSVQRSTSSLKYKTDVVDARFGLADVLKLRAVNYKSKNPADGDKVFGGLIAEEVEEAGLTEFVIHAQDGTPDALNYSNMVSLAFKSIQELKAINDQQAETINALTARIVALEGK